MWCNDSSCRARSMNELKFPSCMWNWLIAVFCLLLAGGVFRWQARRHQQWREEIERHYREEASRRQSEVIAQFQIRQQALFNGMIEGVLLLDGQGRVVMINESLRKVFDPVSDVGGQTIMEAFRWHELAALAVRLQKEKNISEAELEIHRVKRRSWQ